MQKIYWTSFITLCFLIIISFLVGILIIVLRIKGVLSKKFFLVSIFVLLLAFCGESYSTIPYIKDYALICNGSFLEDEGIVVEFTYVRTDPDGNGKTQFSRPKFYIESKDIYIVLNVNDVVLGKKYIVRYLPNTGICEVVHCFE